MNCQLETLWEQFLEKGNPSIYSSNSSPPPPPRKFHLTHPKLPTLISPTSSSQSFLPPQTSGPHLQHQELPTFSTHRSPPQHQELPTYSNPQVPTSSTHNSPPLTGPCLFPLNTAQHTVLINTTQVWPGDKQVNIKGKLP